MNFTLLTSPDATINRREEKDLNKRSFIFRNTPGGPKSEVVSLIQKSDIAQLLATYRRRISCHSFLSSLYLCSDVFFWRCNTWRNNILSDYFEA